MMSMAVTMHPIWQSGATILIAAVAGTLIDAYTGVLAEKKGVP